MNSQTPYLKLSVKLVKLAYLSILPSILMRLVTRLTLSSFILIAPNFAVQAAEMPIKPVSEVDFLGLDLIKADLNTVRSHLWDIGGFLQAKTTVKQRNIDKFFPWSNLRDSYYVQFRYNHAGKITSVKRLYRPYSQESAHPNNEIKTKDIALQLIKEVGQPTSVTRKGWGGSLKYSAYTWQDDKVTIKVDREGSTKLGNVFIEYIIDINDPFEVNKEDKAGQV